MAGVIKFNEVKKNLPENHIFMSSNVTRAGTADQQDDGMSFAQWFHACRKGR
jgi:hypothetical protein